MHWGKIHLMCRGMHRGMRKNDQRALFFIHQCVNLKVFEKTMEATTLKDMWDTLGAQRSNQWLHCQPARLNRNQCVGANETTD